MALRLASSLKGLPRPDAIGARNGMAQVIREIASLRSQWDVKR